MEAAQRKKADDMWHIAEEAIAPSCLKCFSKPEYNDAIINLKGAADIYHGIKDYAKEKACRDRLAFCFINVKSQWEEANEYDKIAQILIKELHQENDAMTYIENSNKSYIAAPDYGEAVRTMTKMGLLLRDYGHIDLAEKTMKFAYEDLISYYHLMIMDKEAPTEYIYKAMDLYLDILFDKNNVKDAVSSCDNFCQIVEKEEGNPKKYVHFYLIMCIGLICLGQNSEYDKSIQKVKNYKNEKMADDNGCIKLIDDLYIDYTNGSLNEDILNRKIKNLIYDFGNGVGKAFKAKLQSQLGKGKNDGNMGIIESNEGKDNFITNESNANDDSDYK